MTRLDLYITYNDGTVLKKEDIVYRDLDRKNIKFVEIRDVNSKELVYKASITGNDSFAYRLRSRMGGSGVLKDRCHILAKYTEKGNKIAFIFESDKSVVIKDTFKPNGGWFDNIQLMPEEIKDYMV